jgi:tetratricopeptide (TPR) repeat protein
VATDVTIMTKPSSRSSALTIVRLAFVILAAVLVAGCSSSEQRAQDYYENGMKLLAANDYARAGVELRNAVKLNKALLPAWQGLARVEEHNNNVSALIPIDRAIVELDPNNVDAKLKLARVLTLAGSLDEALSQVNAAAELDGRNAVVLTQRAVLLYRLNDPEGANRDAKAALEIDPEAGGAMIVIAAERLGRGDTKGAMQILDSNPVTRDRDLGIQIFKLKVLEKTQDLPQAEVVLRRLVELYPDERQFRQMLIRLYVVQKRPADAEKEQRVIAAAHPDDPQAELDLVRLLLAVKDPAAARDELVSRINNGKDVFPYQIALAEFDISQGNTTKGIELLEQLASTSAPDQALIAQNVLAQTYLGQKKIDAAEKVVSDILRKDSRNNGGLRLRAAIRLDQGQVESAINDLRQALNDQPRSPDLMLLLAAAYERSGSMELAEKEFADATKASNFNPRFGLAYVGFLQRRGSAARAEEVVTELASRSPNNIELLSTLAQLRLARGNFVGAQEVAEAIRRSGNDRGLADQILGAALSGRSKYDESIGVLENAYAAAPSAVQPMVSLVRSYLAAKKVDQAKAFLQTVLKANPQNAEAYVLLGQINLNNNAPDEALKAFKTAIEKQPKNVDGYVAAANLYLSQNNNDEALKVIRAGLDVQPGSSALRLVLADILERKGDYEAAIAEYETMLRSEPNSLIVANNLASLLADHRTDKASLDQAESLAVLLKKSPIPQFKETLGWVSYLQGNYETAIPLLEEAVKSLPDNAVIPFHLGMAYLASGQQDKAAEQLKLALSRNPDPELKGKIEAALRKVGI